MVEKKKMERYALFEPFWNRIPKNEENHGGGGKILVQSRENRPGEAHRQLQLATQCYPLCTVLESIIEKWGKKDLAKTTPKRGENKKTRGQ